MKLKREKSNRYIIVRNVSSILIIAISILYFVNIDIYNKWSLKLGSIQQVLLVLLMVSWGTDELVVRKNKSGYIFYVIGAFNFIVAMNFFMNN